MIHLLPILMLASFKPVLICIDPGHPSEIGKGTKGKQITEIKAAWLVGKELAKKLESKGFAVVFTKSSENQFVSNPNRAKIANNSKADLMVRLHCDHAIGESGIATYFANKKGAISGVTGPADSVLKLTRPMAKAFHQALILNLDGLLKDRGLKTDQQTKVGAQHGALIGSIYSKCPSILVEMCVLSNPKDEKVIASKSGRTKLVDALFHAIEAAIAKSPSARIPRSEAR